ncbi:MAG: CsbD family protein [Alphaproteobacteria bacterium HGW-Alphaproteobacteria-12]|nr:MAG: CsbD family protein [Alphaproteobacteria bacterium HGW-Alphaproteobacteria-12]
MNWDQIEGNWTQMKGKIKETWGDITDSDLQKIEGKRDRLAGILQERYGKEKEAAEDEIDAWLARH